MVTGASAAGPGSVAGGAEPAAGAARGAGRAGEGGATGSLALLFLCGILVTLILSIFGNKARATNFLRVLFLYKCFFLLKEVI